MNREQRVGGRWDTVTEALSCHCAQRSEISGGLSFHSGYVEATRNEGEVSPRARVHGRIFGNFRLNGE